MSSLREKRLILSLLEHPESRSPANAAESKMYFRRKRFIIRRGLRFKDTFF
jgi:hypothetical protein